MAKRLHVEVIGIERLPPGRALLVANHAFGWDILFAMSAIRAKTGRPVWALGEHVWWKVPGARWIAAELGTVDGTPENVDALLSRDEIVLVLPGGIREALKPRELRYRLLWGHRYGFVRAAIRNHAPSFHWRRSVPTRSSISLEMHSHGAAVGCAGREFRFPAAPGSYRFLISCR